MNRVELLMEQYEQRIKTANREIEDTRYLIQVTELQNCRSYLKKMERLVVKKECYKSFVAELQRIVLS